jgi:hypothetical protein
VEESDGDLMGDGVNTAARLRKLLAALWKYATAGVVKSYDDPGMIMFVRNDVHKLVWSIPFLPGYA